MDTQIFSGCIPALMTPCHADRTPNFDALTQKGKQLMESGMNGVVYCGSMGDWPLLSDAWRMEGVQRLCESGVPVVVGTGAINTRSAVEHSAHAAAAGESEGDTTRRSSEGGRCTGGSTGKVRELRWAAWYKGVSESRDSDGPAALFQLQQERPSRC